MPSFGVILFAVLISLLVSSGRLTASEDNPWRMDDTDQGDQSIYNLYSKDGRGGSSRAREYVPSIQLETGQSHRGSGETIVPKTRQGAVSSENTDPAGQGHTWQIAPGKSARDGAFGYAGPQPKGEGKSRAARRFGAFPPANGRLDGAPTYRVIKPSPGGIQFGGKFYGAFPPLYDQKSNRQRRQKWLREKSDGLKKGEGRGVPNMPPVFDRGYLAPYPGATAPLGVPLLPGYGQGLHFQDRGLYGYVQPRSVR